MPLVYRLHSEDDNFFCYGSYFFFNREMMYDEVATGTIIDRFPKVMSMEISNLIGVLKSEGLDNVSRNLLSLCLNQYYVHCFLC